MDKQSVYILKIDNEFVEKVTQRETILSSDIRDSIFISTIEAAEHLSKFIQLQVGGDFNVEIIRLDISATALL